MNILVVIPERQITVVVLKSLTVRISGNSWDTSPLRETPLFRNIRVEGPEIFLGNFDAKPIGNRCFQWKIAQKAS